jgi:hypothetical protein
LGYQPIASLVMGNTLGLPVWVSEWPLCAEVLKTWSSHNHHEVFHFCGILTK